MRVTQPCAVCPPCTELDGKPSPIRPFLFVSCGLLLFLFPAFHAARRRVFSVLQKKTLRMSAADLPPPSYESLFGGAAPTPPPWRHVRPRGAAPDDGRGARL